MTDIRYFAEQHPESVALVFEDYGIEVPVTERSLAAAILTYGEDFLEDLYDEIVFSGPEYSNLTGAEKRAAKKAARAEKKAVKQQAKQDKKNARQGVFKESLPGSGTQNTLDLINTVGQMAGAAGAAVGAVGGAVGDAVGAAQSVVNQARGGVAYAPAGYDVSGTAQASTKKKWLPWAIGAGVFILLAGILIAVFAGKRGK